ncbi:MAG: tRNA-binding protein [Bacteroidetes bacterium]|nr:MAG: tRNA-binding protein [Bacteroidota bacterium]
METIDYSAFEAVHMYVGTILEASPNEKARKPAYKLRIDFGPLGQKSSSAQLTEHYTPEQLVGMQVVAVLNFEPKRIAGVKSEVLVLAAVSEMEGTVLLQPTQPVPNGARIS